MANTTTAWFRGHERRFDSEIDGYLYLVNRFIGVSPTLLEGGILQRMTTTSARVSFGPAADELYRTSPDLRGHVQRLNNGWFAITNLSYDDKVERLSALANQAGFIRGKDWDIRRVGEHHPPLDQLLDSN
jgi:hypothetical protein